MGPGLPQVVDRLRETLRPADAGGPTDAELLRRWVTERDEAAFELLVWRHGRLVASVCRRLLRRPEDVEDAFQATFLVLVRKAGGIRGRQAVAAWLHTVAHRVAVAAAARANRLPAGALPDVPTTDPPPADADLRQVIDAEVRRLPERYRQAFVLCCLDGQTAEQAAGQLGVPPGTVLSRLSRARQRLRDRLTRRGLAPSLVPLDGALVGAAVSATLVNATVAAATTQAAGGAVPVSAAVLVTTVLRGMVMTKLHGFAIVILSAALVCGGGAVGLRVVSAGEGDEPRPAETVKKRSAAENQPPPTRPARALAAETAALRAELDLAKRRIADLEAALQKAAITVERKPLVARLPVTEGKPPPPAPVAKGVPPAVGDVVPLLPAPPVPFHVTLVAAPTAKQLAEQVATWEVELLAARHMADEAGRRLASVTRAAKMEQLSEEEVAAATASAVRYQATALVKAAELAELRLQLKRAERKPDDVSPFRDGGGVPSLDQRVDQMQDRFRQLERELDQLRRELKERPRR